MENSRITSPRNIVSCFTMLFVPLWKFLAMNITLISGACSLIRQKWAWRWFYSTTEIETVRSFGSCCQHEGKLWKHETTTTYKHSVLTSLVHRARALCDQPSLPHDLDFLTAAFKKNGYNQQQIKRAMQPVTPTAIAQEKPTATAFLPYTRSTFGRLSRMLTKLKIKSVALPPRKISSFLPPVKEPLGLRTPGIYSIPCECGKVYIGQSGRRYNNAFRNTTDT
jgi:hypothetical protein